MKTMKRSRPRSGQRGGILAFTLLALIGMLMVIALALDMANTYLSLTRLQTLTDSLALSAGIVLNEAGANDAARTAAESAAATTLG